MTDKEPIIIDGIDVSECDHFREGYCHPGTGVCYMCDTNCQYATFYLKEQLSQKTQECEKYKKRAVYFKDVNKQLGYKYLTIKQECEELKERASIAEDNFACEVQARLYHQNEWLKFSKECEELKKQLKTSEKWRINAESLNEKLDIKNTRYRKAFEEIEEIVSKDYYGDTWADISIKLDNIRNIINQAKGEEC